MSWVIKQLLVASMKELTIYRMKLANFFLFSYEVVEQKKRKEKEGIVLIEQWVSAKNSLKMRIVQ